jgi:lysophospholipase L1-like esterase
MRPVALTVLFMGDSITEGQYVDTSLRWTNMIADELTRVYLSTPVNIQFLNKGISGETTRQGLERFPRDVQAQLPDLMTLEFGLNDCNCWVTDRGLPRVSIAAYRANIIEMIQRARLFGAKEIIVQNNHPTLRRKVLLSGESLEDGRKRYNAVVREIAIELGVVFCDIESAFKGLDDSALDAELLPYPDHLHLSVQGHRRYAAAIKPLIEQALQRLIQGNARD